MNTKLFQSLLIASLVTLNSPINTIIITVNNTTDSAVAGDKQCTLREAITNANNDNETTNGDCVAGNGDDVIELTKISGVIKLNSQLEIASNINLKGYGENQLTISGGGVTRVFYIDETTTVSIKGVTISDGVADNGGGGIYNAGTLTIISSTLSKNSTKYKGGALLNSGTATIINSSFLENSSNEYRGGGIFNSGTLSIIKSILSKNSAITGGGIQNDGSLTIIDSTLSQNSAIYHTAGINNGGTLTIIGSTLSQNLASTEGGIYNYGTLTITNSTLSKNIRGGIFNNSGTLIVTNSTLSENIGFGIDNDIYTLGEGFTLVSNGTLTLTNTIIANTIMGSDCRSNQNIIIKNTLIEDGSCNATLTGDPSLGILADNGGPTQTHALLPDSIAIDAGDDITCIAEAINSFDQRGVFRLDKGNTCDLGAYEYQQSDLVTNFLQNFLSWISSLIDHYSFSDMASFTVDVNAIRWRTTAEYGTQAFYLWQAEPVVIGTCEVFTHPQLFSSGPIPAEGNEIHGESYLVPFPTNVNWCYGIQEIPSGRVYITPRPGIKEWIENQWIVKVYPVL